MVHYHQINSTFLQNYFFQVTVNNTIERQNVLSAIMLKNVKVSNEYARSDIYVATLVYHPINANHLSFIKL